MIRWLALIHARIHTSTYWTSVFEGVVELGKLSFALAYAGDAEYMRLPDNRNALTDEHVLARYESAVND